MHNEGKGRKSSLIVIAMLLVLVSVWFSNFSDVAQVQAQTSSSCDRDVISLVECSPSTSSSPASEDSSSVADDSDEKDSNDDDDDDEGDNGEEQEEEQKNGDIESKIPSTAGVPFP
ncbi:MAG: hypothetical protein ACRD8Z_23840 [Nitrososphaeraceae archaeon]